MKSYLLVALALVAACSSKSATTEITTRDSAGVTIIDHPAGAIAAAPQWTSGAPTVTIAKINGPEETFTRVTGARLLSDGRIVVIDFDNRASQPILFSADGSFERLLGRPGSGPGEFQFASIQGILPADTILFYDFQALRLTRMLPSGDLVGSEGLGSIGVMAAGAPVGRLTDGRLVSVPFGMGDTAGGSGRLFRRPAPIIAIDPSRRTIDTVAAGVLGAEMYMSSMSFGGQSATFPAPAPYGSATQVVTAGDLILVATNESPGVASYALPWALRRIVRFERPRRPVDAPAREGYIAFSMAEIERRGAAMGPMKDIMTQQAKNAQFPDSMGYYSSAMLAADSTLWLGEMRSMSDSVPTYVLVGSDGHLKAKMTLPNGSRLLWADSSQVLVVLRDDDDVERVELRPISTSRTTQ